MSNIRNLNAPLICLYTEKKKLAPCIVKCITDWPFTANVMCRDKNFLLSKVELFYIDVILSHQYVFEVVFLATGVLQVHYLLDFVVPLVCLYKS